jgi:hypothetical protein
MARRKGSKLAKRLSPPRRRNAAAQAVRSPKFRPKVFRDPRTYHRPTAKAAERARGDDDDDKEND